MADKETEYRINVIHNFDELIKKAKEFRNTLEKPVKLDVEFSKKFSESGGASESGSGKPRGGSVMTPGSSANNAWRYRLEREQMKFYVTSNATFARVGSAVGGVASGLFNMSMGGGLSGLARGVERGLVRSMAGSNAWAAAFIGAGIGPSLARSRGAAKAAEAAAGAEGAAEGGGLVELAGGVATVSGLTKLAKFIPLLGKVGLALGSAEFFAMDKFTRDVYGRERRAAGFGTNIGQMTAFESTMGRFVDTGNMLKAAQQSMYDITSPAYTAMRVAGINPAQWKDPTQLAEGTIAAVQADLKKYRDRETMLTMAHARGYQALGLDDDALIRLYRGDQRDVNDLLKRAQKEAPFMDMSKDQVKAYQNLYTETDIAAKGLKTFGERLNSTTIPSFMKLDDELEKFYKFFEDGGKIPSFADYVKGAKGRVKVEDEEMLKWFKEHFGDVGSTMQGFDDGTFVGGMLGAGGGPRGIRSRTTQKSQIKFPGGGARGRGDAGFGLRASDIGLVASKGLPPEEAAFLDTLGTGETPRGSYSNRSGDPGGLGGRYQFLLSTWNKEAAKAGVNPKDFSAENQDKVAWYYASEMVWRKTHKDLMTLLKSGPGGVGQAIEALSPGVWNAITNVDPDKVWHSGAIKLYQKKLEEERAAQPAAPAARPTTGPTSLNDMSNFQRDRKLAMTIHNAAGANYVVHGAMLGSGSGNYGSYVG